MDLLFAIKTRISIVYRHTTIILFILPLFPMALINFKLKHPDNIIPWGDAPDTSMHWLGLTEGEYWLDVNKATLYEYTTGVSKEGEDSPYVEYQVYRLVEELASLFEAIAEPVPDAFYTIAKSTNYLYRYYAAALEYLENRSDDHNSYEKTIEWIYSRTLIAEHLTSGPGISFFRNRNHISIVWKADHLAGTRTHVWTAQNGEIEMEYDTFIKEMEDFGNRFFAAMDTQVQIAVAKDWGATQINKERLVQEQQEKRAAFQEKLALLKSEPTKHTEWDMINGLVTKMFS